MERQARHMLECERQKSSNNLAYTKPAIPEGEPWALLRFGVPLTAHQSQSWYDWCFADPQKDARNLQSGVVSSSRSTSSSYAPKYDIDSKPFACWDFGQDVDYIGECQFGRS